MVQRENAPIAHDDGPTQTLRSSQHMVPFYDDELYVVQAQGGTSGWKTITTLAVCDDAEGMV